MSSRPQRTRAAREKSRAPDGSYRSALDEVEEYERRMSPRKKAPARTITISDDDDDQDGDDDDKEDDEFEVEKILAKKTMISSDPWEAHPVYLVKWAGYDDPKDLTWEPSKNIPLDLRKKFNIKNAEATWPMYAQEVHNEKGKKKTSIVEVKIHL